MKEIFIQDDSLPRAYHNALIALCHDGDIVGCSDYNQQQKECSMTIVINKPLAEPRISRLIIGGADSLQQYELEMTTGLLDFAIGHGFHYTYYDRMKDQIQFVINELKRNSETRRAVISLRDFSRDANDQNPPCLNFIQYFIRNNQLCCSVIFRSNDLVEAFFYNAFALIRLQEQIAEELGVEVGSYSHRSNSMHCYSKDFDKLKGFVNAINSRMYCDLTYEYEDFYKELMEEEIPNIMKMVNDLKRKYGVID